MYVNTRQVDNEEKDVIGTRLWWGVAIASTPNILNSSNRSQAIPPHAQTNDHEYASWTWVFNSNSDGLYDDELGANKERTLIDGTCGDSIRDSIVRLQRGAKLLVIFLETNRTPIKFTINSFLNESLPQWVSTSPSIKSNNNQQVRKLGIFGFIKSDTTKAFWIQWYILNLNVNPQ